MEAIGTRRVAAMVSLLVACSFDGSGVPPPGVDAAVVELIECSLDGPREGRVEMTINRSMVSEASVGAPVLVDLSALATTHELWGLAQDDADRNDTVDLAGADLLVTDSEGKRIPLEVAWFDPVLFKGELWFLGELDPSADSTYYLYYGSREGTQVMEAANGTNGREAVWDSDYVSVWHLSEDGGGYDSSTSNNLDGSQQNDGPDISEDVPFGAFSQDFVAADDHYIDFGNKTAFDFRDSMTIEGWTKFRSFDPIGTGETTLLDKRDSYRIAVDGAGALTVKAGTVITLEPGNSVTLDTWHHLAATLDGGLLRLLVDGVEVHQDNLAMDNTILQSNVRIGRYELSDAHMNGWVDEVRVSMAPRSVGYLATQFAMGNDNEAFVTLGSHEPCTGP